jgi:hypothetical protein
MAQRGGALARRMGAALRGAARRGCGGGGAAPGAAAAAAMCAAQQRRHLNVWEARPARGAARPGARARQRRCNDAPQPRVSPRAAASRHRRGRA